MKPKNERLKVYEFLYNRLPFSDQDTLEYEAMQRMELLEEHFDLYLRQIDLSNIEVHWHSEVYIDSDLELINVLLATEYCYYLFILHDFSGEQDRKSTRLNSSHVSISYAVFCLKKKKLSFKQI